MEPPSTAMVYLDKTASVEEILHVLKRDGAVIIKDLVDPSVMHQLESELEPGFAADRAEKRKTDGMSYNESFPSVTERADLVGLSATADHLLTHPTVTGALGALLAEEYPFYLGNKLHKPVSGMQLGASIAIRCKPGTPAQGLHRDDSFAHVRHPGPDGTATAIWAASETTKENGATEAILGSHLWDDTVNPMDHQDKIVYAEMTTGSCLLITGSIYHSGGENATKDDTRLVAVFFYSKDYYRQTQNMFLTIPRDILRKKSEEVQRMLGYTVSKPGAGYYKGGDPLLFLKDPGEDTSDLVTSWYD